ncbi:CHAT domain-containing protein [Streptomyces sp. NPDC051001]|uniref:CHAT domain-containing protein n=1 Tax=Streptomyces sp. NPDC051001 TaxID=3155795 RepID=UPI00342627DE
MREELVQAVWGHVTRIAATRDPSWALDMRVLADAQRLERALLEQGRDPGFWLTLRGPQPDTGELGAHLALGLLHWHACEALPEEAGAQAFDAAVRALTPCFIAGVEPLPPHLLPALVVETTSFAASVLESVTDLRSADDAVALWRRVVAAAPPGDHMAGVMSNLGVAFARRADFTNPADDQNDDRNSAVLAFRAAVAAATRTDPNRTSCLSHLGNALHVRFAQSRDSADLDEAIDICEQAVVAARDRHPDQSMMLTNLVLALLARSSLSGAVADLDRAVIAGERAVHAAPPGHPQRFRCLISLAMVQHARFRWSGAVGDLDGAEENCRRLIAEAPPGGSEQFSPLAILGAVQMERFSQTGVTSHLDAAISLHEQALGSLSPVSSRGRDRRIRLGVALRERFAHRNHRRDITRAVALHEDALAATPDSHPDQAESLSALGMTLRVKYEWEGTPADLDRAIELQEQALALHPAGSPSWAAELGNLGTSLLAKFELTGALEFLNRCIELGEQSLAALPAGSPELGGQLYNLGSALLVRYERTQTRRDLDRAIEVAQESVSATGRRHVSRARVVSTLGKALHARFLRDEVAADLDRAISAMDEAVTITPRAHPEHSRWLMGLAGLLLFRFTLAGRAPDLDRSIEVAERAVAAIPAGRPGRAGSLANLAGALLERYERGGLPEPANRDDLDRALRALKEAVATTATDHPERGTPLIALGNALLAQPGQAPADREAAADAYTEAANMVTASPSLRIRATRLAAALLVDSKPGEAACLLGSAVELLPETVHRQLERGDQQRVLSEFAGLANDAAALVLASRSPVRPEEAARALALLEQGRGVLLSQALDTRSELTALAESEDQAHRALAAEYLRLRDELDRADTSAAHVMHTDAHASAARKQDTEIADRHRLNEQFTSAVARIRKIEGFKNFHLPPKPEELIAEAQHGPVVVFNISEYGSGALLLTTSGIRYQPLPGLSQGPLIKQVNAFHQDLWITNRAKPEDEKRQQEWLKEWVSAQERLNAALEWLWEVAAEPVLTALEEMAPRPEAWRRVWWAPGGLLGLLPLHAAGRHRAATRDGARSRDTVMDRVISSYTPTVRALGYARRRVPTTSAAAAGAPARSGKALIVAMPTTPAAAPLPNVRDEVRMLTERLPDHILLLEGDTESEPGQSPQHHGTDVPTVTNVRTQLPRCAIAHFACHGSVHPTDPSQSKLLLHDPNAPLTVSDLASLSLEGAWMAYLSACGTAANLAQDLIDEAIHLTSAFQLAGFRHVIGTLWPINDRVGLNVATDFYLRATTGSGTIGVSGDGNDKVAESLHAAVLAARDLHAARPSLWASYIHAGA